MGCDAVPVGIPQKPRPEPVPGHVTAGGGIRRADHHILYAVREAIGDASRVCHLHEGDGDLIEDVGHVDEPPVRGHRAFRERDIAGVLQDPLPLQLAAPEIRCRNDDPGAAGLHLAVRRDGFYVPKGRDADDAVRMRRVRVHVVKIIHGLYGKPVCPGEAFRKGFKITVLLQSLFRAAKMLRSLRIVHDRLFCIAHTGFRQLFCP